MTELLKHASHALIDNDAATLERLAEEAAAYTGPLSVPGPTALPAELGRAVEVLRQQVRAASVQVRTRQRLSATTSLKAHAWAR